MAKTCCKYSSILDKSKEKKRKRKCFSDTTEEEVLKRTLLDHLAPCLDIVIIGINPGLISAYKGHHYAGPTNHFWKCLNLSGLTPEPMTASDDFKLLKFGIGFTNVVERTTKSSVNLDKQEIMKGCKILLKKLQTFKPKIAVFNGKLIYEVFSGNKDFSFGLQHELVQGVSTYIWVMPSSSARSSHLPSPLDKLPYYSALKKFRDYINGEVSEVNRGDFIFHIKSSILTSNVLKKGGIKVKSEYFDDSAKTNLEIDLNCRLESLVKYKCDSVKGTEKEIESNLKILRSICHR